ncbi:MAG TPA: cytochrome P460 family protein [Terriglobia bacterium]|nr:cytochrome P460 family protein [Terriglobia bacterium]
MNCSSARETLPLYAGGDLSTAEMAKTSLHLQDCPACRQICESLERNQGLLGSLRQPAVAPAALDAMRRELLPRLATVRLGWWVRFERLVLGEGRRPRWAMAGAAIVAIVSITLFVQLRNVTATANVAVFEDQDTLRIPEDYRNWIAVGTASRAPHSGNVYMSPVAYREYRRSGTFPEGTVMVLESETSEGALTVEASVKDRRFSEGWGFFRFEGTTASLARKAQALPSSAGCLACHRASAAKAVLSSEL